MRLPVLIAAAAALLASAAMAQPAATPPRNIDVPAAPVLAGDANQPATDLSGLNLRIEADEVTMTRLRNAELAPGERPHRRDPPGPAVPGPDLPAADVLEPRPQLSVAQAMTILATIGYERATLPDVIGPAEGRRGWGW
ncbi:MAG: hypothetical protein WDM92_12280 [Caulobacteraceae bacterium]